MTVQAPAIFLQSEAHPAEDVRRWIMALSQDEEGIFFTGDLAPTEKGTPDMSVDIATGRCLIKGDEDTYQGSYFCDNRGTTNVAIAAADPDDPRIDIIVAKVEDSEYSGATDAWSIVAVTGTPAGSPSAPSAPSNSIPIATVAVAALASSIVDANITDDTVLIVSAGSLDTRLTTAEASIVTNAGNISTNSTNITTVTNNTAAVTRSGTTTTITDTTLVDVNATTITLDSTTLNLDGSGTVSVPAATLVDLNATTVTLDATTINLDASGDIVIGDGSGAATVELASGNTALQFTGGANTLFGHNDSNFFCNPVTTGGTPEPLRHAAGVDTYGIVSRVSSTRRIKTNIEPIPASFSEEIVKNVRAVFFESTLQHDIDNGLGVQHGFIAEEIAENVHEDLAYYDKEGLPDGINRTMMDTHLWNTVQTLLARVEDLEGKLKKAK